jgi:hypothetical protein
MQVLKKAGLLVANSTANLSGFDPNHDNDTVPARKSIPLAKGCLAFTTGQPVSGEPKTIEVKTMVPGSQPISIPLRCLKLVMPRRAAGAAVVIAGEHFGKEVLVLGESGAVWDLLIVDGSETRVSISPDHLVELRGRLLSLSQYL